MLPPESVAAIIPDKTYSTEGVSAGPALPWHGWKTQTNFGFSVQQGFQQARTLSAGVNAVRRQPAFAGLTERWRTNFALNILLATTESSGVRISANTINRPFRQDYLWGPGKFIFGLGQIDKIQPQDLNLRQTYGGGIGRDLVTKTNLQFSASGG